MLVNIDILPTVYIVENEFSLVPLQLQPIFIKVRYKFLWNTELELTCKNQVVTYNTE